MSNERIPKGAESGKRCEHLHATLGRSRLQREPRRSATSIVRNLSQHTAPPSENVARLPPFEVPGRPIAVVWRAQVISSTSFTDYLA